MPHRFSDARDIEIAGFLAATIAWGQRVTLIRNANWLLDRMDNAPADFIANPEHHITAEQIKATWHEKLNRLFFYFTGEADTIHLAMIQEEIEEDLIEAINNLPNAPDESAWEILNEDIFWGEDDEY